MDSDSDSSEILAVARELKTIAFSRVYLSKDRKIEPLRNATSVLKKWRSYMISQTVDGQLWEELWLTKEYLSNELKYYVIWGDLA